MGVQTSFCSGGKACPYGVFMGTCQPGRDQVDALLEGMEPRFRAVLDAVRFDVRFAPWLGQILPAVFVALWYLVSHQVGGVLRLPTLAAHPRADSPGNPVTLGGHAGEALRPPQRQPYCRLNSQTSYTKAWPSLQVAFARCRNSLPNWSRLRDDR